MNLKELVNQISTEQGIPAARVRRISAEVLKLMSSLIEKGEEFKSPFLRIMIRDIPERNVKLKKTGETKLVPAHKLAVAIKPKAKAKTSAVKAG